MHGNGRADERAAPNEIAGFDDVLPFASEHAKKFIHIFRQPAALNADGFELFEQAHGGGFAYLAVAVADDGNFASALDGTGQRQRAHGAAQRARDDVAGIAQPDKVLRWQGECVREESIQAWINARQGNDG